jgi:hypothetical protein
MRRTRTDLGDVLERASRVEREMFRLETLPAYDVAYELDAYQRFLSDNAVDLTPGQWQEMIAGHVEAGRSCRRVHVVSQELSDYLRYEIAGPYARSAAAGEQIRLLTTETGTWPEGVPTYDFWLFDDEVWIMDYAPGGRFERLYIDDDPDVVNEHRQAAVTAWAAASAPVPAT